MRRFDKLRLRFRSLLRRAKVEDELAREMQFHLDEQIQENMNAGMDAQEARSAALRAIGNIGLLKEECREKRGLRFFEESARNLHYAIRVLRRNATLTAVSVLTLAFGIGATTAIFSLLYTTVLAPVAYTEADRLVVLEPTNTAPNGTVNGMPWSYPKFQDARTLTTAFESIAGFASAEFSITDAGDPERLRGEYVSTSYFTLLDVPAAIGRTFLANEDATPNSPAIVVISDSLWRRKFAADPGVVGKTIRINRIPFTIVGIAPQFFKGETASAELWVPISMAPAVTNIPARLTRRFSHWFRAVARLKPGVAVSRADEDLKQAVTRFEELQPSDPTRQRTFSGRAVPLLEAKVDPDVRRALTVLFAAVGFVLLITCLNLSSLMLSRHLARHTEISTRLAIGAGRWTLVRQFMTESLLLATIGGVAALVVAALILRLLPMLEPAGLITGGASAFIRGLNFDAISLQRPLFLLFNLALSIAAGFCFGTLPALHGSRLQPNEGFAIGRHRKYTARRVMLVAQVALAVVLLAGAGVMLRSFGKLLGIDVGVNPDSLIVFRLELPGNLYPGDAPRQFFQNLLGSVASLPGVERAAIGNTIPLRGQNEVTMGTVDGHQAGEVALHIVSTDYFQTLGIPLLKGRSFTEDDRANSPHVAVISESAARRFFGDQNPLDHTITRVSRPGEEARIIGVVGNSKYRLIEMGPDSDVYVSHLQAEPWPGNYVVLKSRMPTESTISLARAEVRKLDPLVPMYDATTMSQVVANATARTRFSSVLLAIFAGLALVVAGVGIYGLLTYTVSQCTREIGIRIALGAKRSHIGRIVVRDGLALCIVGLVIGLAGAYLATRLLRGLLYQVMPTDPLTFIGVAGVFIGTAVLACWLPARRATRVDPIVALRHE